MKTKENKDFWLAGLAAGHILVSLVGGFQQQELCGEKTSIQWCGLLFFIFYDKRETGDGPES